MHLSQVVLELPRHLHSSFDLVCRDEDTVFVIFLAFCFRQSDCDLEGCHSHLSVMISIWVACAHKCCKLTISNLSAIPLQISKLLGLDIVFSCLRNAHRRLTIVFELLEESVPQPASVFVVEFRIVDLHVNAGHESFIESPDSIGGEEKDALVVFQGPQESGHKVIALDV